MEKEFKSYNELIDFVKKGVGGKVWIYKSSISKLKSRTGTYFFSTQRYKILYLVYHKSKSYSIMWKNRSMILEVVITDEK